MVYKSLKNILKVFYNLNHFHRLILIFPLFIRFYCTYDFQMKLDEKEFDAAQRVAELEMLVSRVSK